MKKIILIASILLSTSLLGGCQQAQNTSRPKEKVQKTTKTSTTTSSTTDQVEKTEVKTDPFWQQAQKDQLAAFMGTWGRSMNQNYQEYLPEKALPWFGEIVTKEVLEEPEQLLVEG